MDFFEKIELAQGDITQLNVECIVNAANTSLLGGGGVDGAIHRVAGKELLDECKTLNGCKTGEAKITNGYNLPAKFVIHTVGPVWHGGTSNEDTLLSNAYKNSLLLANQHKIKTIAFPSISTGVYNFPFERACIIALKQTLAHLAEFTFPTKVIFISFSIGDYEEYQRIFDELRRDKV